MSKDKIKIPNSTIFWNLILVFGVLGLGIYLFDDFMNTILIFLTVNSICFWITMEEWADDSRLNSQPPYLFIFTVISFLGGFIVLGALVMEISVGLSKSKKVRGFFTGIGDGFRNFNRWLDGKNKQ